MKIAQIVSTYPPYYGGMGNVVFQMTSALAARGHEVEVLTPDVYEETEIRPEATPPAETHTLPLTERIDYARRLKPSLQYGNAARLPDIQHELDRFDIVHLHYPFFGTANLVRKWKLRHPEKPLVITYHMDTRSGGWKGVVFSIYAKWWLPKILAAGDLVIGSSFDYIAVSDAARSFATEKKKWRELPFGVDIERFAPREKPVALLEQYGLKRDTPTILFVGGMDAPHYFKGVSVFLEAIFLLHRGNVPIQSVLVGDGDERENFLLKARGLGIEQLVRFVGRVSDEALPLHYNLADLLVLPSTTAGEAFGMVLLEAMASGVPVIASDLPGVRTVAADGGMTVPPRDPQALARSIAEFFSATTDRNGWREQARAVACSRYAWEPIAADLEQLYQSVLS